MSEAGETPTPLDDWLECLALEREAEREECNAIADALPARELERRGIAIHRLRIESTETMNVMGPVALSSTPLAMLPQRRARIRLSLSQARCTRAGMSVQNGSP